MALAAALALVAAGCMGDDEGGGEAGGTTTVTVTETVAASGRSATGDTFGRIPDVVRKVDPAVVSISTDQGEGSGVIWSKGGLVVTNNHVIEGASSIEVELASGEQLPASTEATDPLSDLAVLRIERDGLPAAAFERRLPVVGQLAIAIGNPSGFEQSVSAGIVSGLHRAIPESAQQTQALVDLIQTDAAISPGNSGGALVDANGKVIGINVAYIPPTEGSVSLGFAIPAATVVSVVEQLLETGRVERAYLGVEGPFQVTPEMAANFGLGVDQGVGIEDVQPGRAAAKAGIEGGDVIVSIDGRPIAAVEDLFAELRRLRPGQTVRVVVFRDGERRTVEVTLDERP
jgi:S1-C subfamily serine protease